MTIAKQIEKECDSFLPRDNYSAKVFKLRRKAGLADRQKIRLKFNH
jgi:hypothetical protein